MSDCNKDEGSSDDADEETSVYQTRSERKADVSLSTAVVKAVAAFRDEPPTDLEPLYEVIDPEVLNQVYETVQQFPDSQQAGSTTFTYSECEVTVFWNGDIEVQSEDSS